MNKADILCELVVFLDSEDSLTFHVPYSVISKFHKRMENFIANRRSKSDNFGMHSIEGTVFFSKNVRHYAATELTGDPVKFILTPAG